ncbi:hypothetical protein JCM8547_003398 [Rhodosporidiobolus lusitaniae]
MGKSIIDEAKEFTASEEGQDLLRRLSAGSVGSPTLTDDLPDLVPDSDQYRFNHNNLDHVPASSAAATGFGADTYAGAPWGGGPPPGSPTLEEEKGKWIGTGITSGINGKGTDSLAIRNYGKGELLFQ